MQLSNAGALSPFMPIVHELVLHAGSGRVLGRLAVASREPRVLSLSDRDLLLRLGGAPCQCRQAILYSRGEIAMRLVGAPVVSLAPAPCHQSDAP